MVRSLVISVLILISCLDIKAQNLQNVLKYSTFYVSGIGSTPVDAPPEYFVDQASNIQEITQEFPLNYNISIGLRKIARFDYEQRQNQFYDGKTESTVAASSNIGAVKGLEYIAQYELGRQQGMEYTNQRYFIRYLGDYTLTKVEYRNNGLVDLNFLQVDTRFRQKIGKKLNLSVGLMGRWHDPYGIDPIGDYLNENPWWVLAYEYGYNDYYYGIDLDNDGTVDSGDWSWTDPDGNEVAANDLDFRQYIYNDIVNQYNDSILSGISTQFQLSTVIGLDFYHYEDNFWFHTWGNIIPYHFHSDLLGDHSHTYHHYNDLKQWVDFNYGALIGIKIKRKLGIFIEGEHTQYWKKNLYDFRVGVNYQFR
jgi:hypothetical protein